MHIESEYSGPTRGHVRLSYTPFLLYKSYRFSLFEQAELLIHPIS
jgi:hypothetical protein